MPPFTKNRQSFSPDNSSDEAANSAAIRGPRSPSRRVKSPTIERSNRYHTTTREGVGAGLGRQKRSRHLFTLAEDMLLIEYLCTKGVENHDSAFAGYAVVMAFSLDHQEISDNHTEQSLHNRVRTIRKNIDKFNIKPEWRELLRPGNAEAAAPAKGSTASTTVRRPATKPSTSSAAIARPTHHPKAAVVRAASPRAHPVAARNNPAKSVLEREKSPDSSDSSAPVFVRPPAKKPAEKGKKPARVFPVPCDRLSGSREASPELGEEGMSLSDDEPASAPPPQPAKQTKLNIKDFYRTLASQKTKKKKDSKGHQEDHPKPRKTSKNATTQPRRFVSLELSDSEEDNALPVPRPVKKKPIAPKKLVLLESSQEEDDGLSNVVRKSKPVKVRKVLPDVAPPVAVRLPSPELEPQVAFDPAVSPGRERSVSPTVIPGSRERSLSLLDVEVHPGINEDSMQEAMAMVQKAVAVRGLTGREASPFRSPSPAPAITGSAQALIPAKKPETAAATDVEARLESPEIPFLPSIGAPRQEPVSKTFTAAPCATSAQVVPTVTDSDEDRPPDNLATLGMVKKLAKVHGISTKQCLWALFINNGSPLMTVKWLVEASLRACTEPPVNKHIDWLLLTDGDFAVENLAEETGISRATLTDRLTYLQSSQEELQQAGADLESALEELHRYSFVPRDLREEATE